MVGLDQHVCLERDLQNEGFLAVKIQTFGGYLDVSAFFVWFVPMIMSGAGWDDLWGFLLATACLGSAFARAHQEGRDERAEEIAQRAISAQRGSARE